MQIQDPTEPRTQGLEDLEEDLAAALPETQGSRFYPLIRRWALHVVPFLLLAAAIFVLWREFRDVSPAEIGSSMRAWGYADVVLALLLSAASFTLMGFVEWFGLRWAGARLPIVPALWGSFLANAIGHTLGANLLVSGAVRARFYDRFGVSLKQVAATTVFHGVSFAVGLSALSGVSLLVAKGHDTDATRIAGPVADGLGVLLLVGVTIYVALCGNLKRPLRGFGHSLKLPSWRVALAQIGLGAFDNAVAAGIIWTLLPEGSVGYFSFVGAYAPSVVVGLISHVPGGVGVFEGSLSALLASVRPAPLAAAFLGYRLAFFLLPLLIAAVALTGDAMRRRGRG
ncbi:lysylphosphatidylglycerol synthase domain-containing protein [Phenylobacterium sp. VNQ135]|uniref:lysylphosphatidylglycerol synthase domain-containing protein n=1 Tax=Phenylobacterium sp. VNQ135 TaxID=3400922 RepID=UPI003C0ACAC8